MPILQGDLIQITLLGYWNQQAIMLTHHLKVRTPPSGGQTTSQALQSLLTAIAGETPGTLARTYLECLPDNYTMRIRSAQKIYPTREVMQSQSDALVGLWESGTALTGQLAGVITLRTEKAGRSQVSNKHIGPAPDDGILNGQTTAAWRVPLDNLANALETAITAANGAIYDPCIYHRGGDGAAAKSDLITSYVLQPTARVMRRRTVGLGI